MGALYDAAALRKMRKERIAARTAKAQADQATPPTTPTPPAAQPPAAAPPAGDAPPAQPPADQAQSAFNYNPMFSKPTNLGADKPRGGYHYFGPPPDAGTSYGMFSTGFGGMIAPMPAEGQTAPKDPSSGQEVKLEGPADKDALAAMHACVAQMQTMPPCSGCGKVFVTSADVMNKPVASMHCVACGDNMTQKVQEMKANAKPGDVQAVQYEALSAVESLTDVVEADVHMTLFDEQSKNPYWNVDIKGAPVARIYLADQPKPEETKAVFLSKQYFDGVSQAIGKVGVMPILTQLNAKFWANKIDETAIATKARETVKAELDVKAKAETNAFLDDYLKCIALTCAGMDKNFFKDEGNALKESIYAQFRAMGVDSNRCMAAIEAAFKQGSTAYFRAVLDKALEFKSMEPIARAQVEKVIGDADVLTPDVPQAGGGTPLPVDTGNGNGDPTMNPTLAGRLKDSSVAVSSVMHIPSGPSSVKDNIRGKLGFGRK